MRRLLISGVLLTTLLLGGCGTTQLFRQPEKQTSTVCNKITPPREVSLKTFTFFPVPVGTTGEGGVPLAAGVTADGLAVIVENLATLKKREGNWQDRAKAINNCLDQEAKDRGKINGKK
jgi:hypothetical protein